jgi:RelA/SpoT family (p)ppGpp synthetase
MSELHGTIDFAHPPTSTDPDVLYSVLELQAKSYLSEEADVALLERAYRRAAELHRGTMRDSGEPYITHPLHVALILSHLELDVQTLAAALLHDVLEDTKASYEDLIEEFGDEIAGLVEGVTKLSRVSRQSRADQSAANIQKVFLAMSEDTRVIFIKLADRLHNLRTLGARQNADSRERSATEALSVYARIANRLGIAILRKEMEDLAFSYLNPSLYQRVKRSIDQRYEDSANLIAEIQSQVLSLLESNGIGVVEGGIHPNPRRVYDMFLRLQEMADPSPGKPKRVPPQLRFHLIVEDISSCYLAMAAIHSRWPPIASETRDYISAPLANGYQSLHTTVFIDEQPIKFQIRTLWMHTTSQLGIIAHMRGGEWSQTSPELKRTVDDLRQFGVEAVSELSDPAEFLTTLKAEVLGDDIYVYTPRNKVIQLPVGSTPIDFAYHIHTDVGHQCRGALVDGHWVSLKRPLRTGERVEILTVDHAGPYFDWLNPDLRYTQSPLARSKIRRWFRRRPDREKVALGREQLHRVARRLSLDLADFDALAKRFTYPDEEALFRDIGGCDVGLERIVPELLDAYGEGQLPQICAEEGPSRIPVVGAGSLDMRLASCCRPQPGDDIVGHIPASDHTVEVHRSDCSTFLRKLAEDRHRSVEVKWGRACETHLACMEILSHDRPFYLRDVWEIISDLGLNVADVDVKVNRARDARILVCIDVESWLQFNCVLSRIEDLPGTIWVNRSVLYGDGLPAGEGEEDV